MEIEDIIKLLNKVTLMVIKSDLSDEETNDINKVIFEIRDLLVNDNLFSVPDVRNKLSPITHLISMVELDEKDFIKEAIPGAKKSINYLSKRNVYKNIT